MLKRDARSGPRTNDLKRGGTRGRSLLHLALPTVFHDLSWEMAVGVSYGFRGGKGGKPGE